MRGKKITALLLCATVTMSLLAGCGSSSSEEAVVTGTTSEQEKVAAENAEAPKVDTTRKTTADSEDVYKRQCIR